MPSRLLPVYPARYSIRASVRSCDGLTVDDVGSIEAALVAAEVPEKAEELPPDVAMDFATGVGVVLLCG